MRRPITYTYDQVQAAGRQNPEWEPFYFHGWWFRRGTSVCGNFATLSAAQEAIKAQRNDANSPIL